MTFSLDRVPTRYDRWLIMAHGHGSKVMVNSRVSESGEMLAPHPRDPWCGRIGCCEISLKQALSILKHSFVVDEKGTVK